MAIIKSKWLWSVLLALWDILIICIIGLNSFILLYLRNQEHSDMYRVIYAFLNAYIVVFVTEIIVLLFFRRNVDLRNVLYFTRKIFRLIYTAVYLTIIMITLIHIEDYATPDQMQNVMIYNSVMFVGISINGTSCIWGKKLKNWVLKKRLNQNCSSCFINRLCARFVDDNLAE
ncbi:hypothetical protein [Oceanirhabdus seepicola]|uniref:Uncharacterized protein n=1 Tax=Oceanirhabdus seepicola TaxID=2828781 RepID=A0A9J6P6K3_9CLOT|nr:hypothetical protein [Oceanirhabdus seepicola]MCM1991429.1 hypothetical protein [Oceanirhabdus seepicola]